MIKVIEVTINLILSIINVVLVVITVILIVTKCHLSNNKTLWLSKVALKSLLKKKISVLDLYFIILFNYYEIMVRISIE